MNNLHTILFALSLLILGSSLSAQVPSPGKASDKTTILLNGVAHIGNGEVIENSAIGFKDGKITFVADAKTIKLDLANSDVIKIEGKHVYPGFIAPSTTLGLVEIGAVRATRDQREVGTLNPNIRSLIAYNTDSRVTPTVRSNGILTAQIAPQGGRISGQSSIVHLDAWNWEDAAIVADDGIYMNWPAMFTYSGWWAEPGGWNKNKKYEGQIADMKRFFGEAKAYASMSNHDKSNLKFEAMRGLFTKEKQLFIRVGYVRSMLAAIDFAEEFDLKIVLIGGGDAWKIADILAEKNIPLILIDLHSLPDTEDDDIDQPFKNAKILTEAGVKVGLGINGFWQQRNLMFMAGTAAAYGLDKEEALKLITSNTAEILGVGDQLGTLEKGKLATLIVSKGDALDMRTNHIEHAFVAGRKVDLDNKQKALYTKFREKYFD